MFKKLKDKIAEDLKFSPQRFTSEKNHSDHDENFFSLADDDTVASSSGLGGEFTDVSLQASSPMEPRTRKLSNSSMASDVSFLPRYEPLGNLYHMQSDLDVSASEIEDNVSMSSQLGHISKEQVYSAFQKAQMRYHKYRGRYTDLANHYKILEKENGKIKTILVETQDKAIRRVNELKEQCSLEQKAKAHLENALRVELDEKQIKIDTLQTKIKLLQNSGDKSDLLIDTGENRTGDNSRSTSTSSLSEYQELTKFLNDARAEIENLNEKLQETKANAIIFNTKEADYKQKINNLEKQLQERNAVINQCNEREKENNLKLAQSKMELHAEIHNKDLEIANLKRDLENLKHEIDKAEKTRSNVKLENLQTQNAKMIDKIETLNQKCSNYESELIKLEQYKVEIGNLNEIILNLKKINEELIQKKLQSEIEIKKEFDQKLHQLRMELSECKSQAESSAKENEELKSRLVEFEEVKRQNEELLLRIEESQSKNADLLNELQNQKLHFEEETAKLREDTKQTLIVLESKIKEKLESEFLAKEENIKQEFQAKLEELLTSSESVKQVEIDLMQAKDSLKSLENVNRTLTSDLNNLQAKYRELETNHLDLITEGNQTRVELSVLEKENANQKSAVICSEAEIQSLREEIKKLQEENMTEREKLLKLEEELTASKRNEDLSEVLEEVEVLRARNEEKYQEIQALKEVHENEMQMKASEYKVLQTEFSFLQEVLTKQQNENCLLQEEKRNMERQIEESESMLDERNQEIVGIQESIAGFNRTIDTLRLENTKLEEDNAKLRHDTKIQIENLQQENENKIKVIELRDKELENIIEERDKDLQTVKREHETSSKQKEELSARLEAIEQEKITLEKEKQSNQAEISQLTKTIEDLKQYESKYQTILGENYLLEEETIKLSKTLEELKQYKSKYQSILDENHNLKEQISRIEELKLKLRHLEELESSFKASSLERDTVMKDLGNMEKQKVEAINENKRLKQDILELKVTVEKMKDLERDNSKLEENISQLHAQINEIMRDNREFKEELSKYQQVEARFADISTEVNELRNRCLQLSNENNELHERNHQVTLDYKQILHENEKNTNEYAELKLKWEEIEKASHTFNDTKQQLAEEISNLNEELQRYKTKLSLVETEKSNLEKLQSSTVETTENQTTTLKSRIKQLEEEKSDYESLFNEYKQMKTDINNITQAYDKCVKEKKDIENQLRELEGHYNEITHEKQLLKDEIQELKISPLNLTNKNSKSDKTKAEKKHTNEANYKMEIEDLRDKLEQYKSIDKANRASIEFYETELQKLKVKNEKLSRKLDDTLVTLPVLTGANDLGDSHAKLEYLRNILYNYMIGRENLVLAKVITAVCKFDKEQTELILQKEQQRQTLLGQLFGS